MTFLSWWVILRFTVPLEMDLKAEVMASDSAEQNTKLS